MCEKETPKSTREKKRESKTHRRASPAPTFLLLLSDLTQSLPHLVPSIGTTLSLPHRLSPFGLHNFPFTSPAFPRLASFFFYYLSCLCSSTLYECLSWPTCRVARSSRSSTRTLSSMSATMSPRSWVRAHTALFGRFDILRWSHSSWSIRYRFDGTHCSNNISAATNAHTGEGVAIKKVTNVFSKKILAKRALREIKLLQHFRGHRNVRYPSTLLFLPKVAPSLEADVKMA